MSRRRREGDQGARVGRSRNIDDVAGTLKLRPRRPPASAGWGPGVEVGGGRRNAGMLECGLGRNGRGSQDRSFRPTLARTSLVRRRGRRVSPIDRPRESEGVGVGAATVPLRTGRCNPASLESRPLRAPDARWRLVPASSDLGPHSPVFCEQDRIAVPELVLLEPTYGEIRVPIPPQV